MIQKAVTLSLLAAALVATATAGEGPKPTGVPHLDHVYVIMMENHGYSQIVNNPNAPFINQFATANNSATNYFAVAHPASPTILKLSAARTLAYIPTIIPIGTMLPAPPT